MTDIRFYHLKTQTVEEALMPILAKALSAGHRVIVKLVDDKQVESVNEFLWVSRPDNFLPHGSAKDGHAEDQPIWITSKDENPNGAKVIILGANALSDKIAEFTMACEMLPGHDEDGITAARARWKTYKDAGHDVTYWQQTDAGGWEKKA
jgi:DNA polymerase-3 subunit chi